MPVNPKLTGVTPSGAYSYVDDTGLEYYVEPDNAVDWGLPLPEAPDFSAPPAAQAMAPAPAPMPDQRLAQSDADKISASLGQAPAPPVAMDAGVPQIQNRAPMLPVADPGAVTPESIDAQQAQFAAKAEQALSPPQTQPGPAMPENTVTLGGPSQAQQQQDPTLSQQVAAGAMQDLLNRGGAARVIPGGMMQDAQVVKGNPEATGQLMQAQGALTERRKETAGERYASTANQALQQNKELLQQNIALGFAAQDQANEVKKREGELMRRQQQAQRHVEEAASAQVDPKRFWKTKDAGERVLMSLAVGLGAFGGALTGSPNTALQIINDQIRLDIEAQENELNSKKELAGALKSGLAEWRQEYGPEIARKMLEATLKKRAANEARMGANSMASEDARLAAMETADMLDQESLDRQRELAGDIELTQSYKYQPEKVVGGRRRFDRGDVEAAQYFEGVIEGRPQGDPKNVVFDPLTKQPLGATPDPGSAKQAREAVINGRQLLNNIDRLRFLTQKASKLKPADRARLQSQYSNLLVSTNKGLGLGALDKGSQEVLAGKIGQLPTDVTAINSQTIAAMEENRATAEQGMRINLNGLGIDGDRLEYGVDPSTQAQLDE